MAKTKEVNNLDTSTEEKIKEAARSVFHQKGFAATRTRDIAEEAGINLALLNYYFRSKQKLFDIIMLETLSGFIHHLTTILNDGKTSLEKKIELIASNYINFLSGEPGVPLFIMSELRNNPTGLMGKLPIKDVVLNSEFIKQYQAAVENEEVTEPNPLQFLMNVMGLVIFPFIAQPLITSISKIDNQQFSQMMQKRKKLIPVWIKAMMKAK
ncbi:TetR/AcrR family transcriptional regulator [Chryseobacterium sp. Marseille-Q3244]|uniref:TetR/AcrR family transcriptional regulator n=1 Tax=Chryseobacterium sp. Marseille-Q3244 TaxID=2758092 RepID=UPI002025B1EE|nr:TetR/AcrR family transcriptional regulator [Chryseobacterium sp. Marseille-Q3244]